MCVLTDRWSFGTATVANSHGFLMMESGDASFTLQLIHEASAHNKSTSAAMYTRPHLSSSHFSLFVFLTTGMTLPSDCWEFGSGPELLG